MFTRRTFEGIQRVKISQYDDVTKTITTNEAPVLVFASSNGLVLYYAWARNTKTGTAELKNLGLKFSGYFSPEEIYPFSVDKFLNGQDPAQLTFEMRPRRRSDVGFLDEEEKLEQILALDDAAVTSMGLSHKKIASGLQYFVELYEYLHKNTKSTGPMMVIGPDGKEYLLSGKSWRGYQDSPFNDGTKTNVDVHIVNPRNGADLWCSGLVPEMGGRYGFWEGNLRGNENVQHWGRSYRVPPKLAAHVLELP